ncbi:MAG: virulence factor SrfB, partial [Succinivibrionaceae bacterium]|nr:virulence factor SrfB [Succinivibrionaceae bacterium]
MIPQAITDEKSHEYEITLFEKTNIQFLDFDLNIDEDTFNESNSYMKTSYSLGNNEEKQTHHLIKKKKNLDNDTIYLDLVTKDEYDNVSLKSFSYEDSISLYEKQWFPLPILKKTGVDEYIKQPIAWARGYISDVTKEDVKDTLNPKDGIRRYRLVVALDTNISDDDSDELFVTREDVNNGDTYGLCSDYNQLEKFILDYRVREWLFGIYLEKKKKEDPDRDLVKIEREANDKAEFIAHYVNLITLINNKHIANIPQIKIKPTIIEKKDSCIP